MKDLWLDLMDNIKEATKLLEDNERYHEFNSEENIPFVLVSDRHDFINNLEVSKIRLNEDDIIEMYLPEWDEWLNINECLSTTANNICIALSEEC